MQYVHFLQRKYQLSSFNLLGHTAPAQAASLLLVGPFLDYWLTNKRVYAYDYNTRSLVSTTAILLCLLRFLYKVIVIYLYNVHMKIAQTVLNYPIMGKTLVGICCQLLLCN